MGLPRSSAFSREGDVADTAIGGTCEIQAGTEDTALLLAWWSAWPRRQEYAHGIAAEQRVQQASDVPDTATGGTCEIQAGTEDTALLLAWWSAWPRRQEYAHG